MSEYLSPSAYEEQPLEAAGPASTTQVLREFEQGLAKGTLAYMNPLSTGFTPLDEVLNGGLHPGELMLVGGPFGVGKTIFALQIARNVAKASEDNQVIYICYEHSRLHLMSRLLCLESVEHTKLDDALTLRKLTQLSEHTSHSGTMNFLRQDARYAATLRAVEDYSDRLVLAKANGAYTSLGEISQWIDEYRGGSNKHVLVVVDYLQKIPVNRDIFRTEDEATTILTQGLKDMALTKNVHVIAIAASDRMGLQAKRMQLSDMRGSSALQYETDIGIMLNRKFDIVSREHLIYNLSKAEAMRYWIVISVEKNRAGLNAVDIEHQLDAAHFRFVPEGAYVRERLIDGKAVLE